MFDKRVLHFYLNQPANDSNQIEDRCLPVEGRH